MESQRDKLTGHAKHRVAEPYIGSSLLHKEPDGSVRSPHPPPTPCPRQNTIGRNMAVIVPERMTKGSRVLVDDIGSGHAPGHTPLRPLIPSPTYDRLQLHISGTPKAQHPVNLLPLSNAEAKCNVSAVFIIFIDHNVCIYNTCFTERTTYFI